jgi:phosphate transport system ATP-binding protein
MVRQTMPNLQQPAGAAGPPHAPKIRVDGVTYAYGSKVALESINLDVPEHSITVLFGPAGSGKTTLLRLVNRLNDLLSDTHMSGNVLIGGKDIYAPDVRLSELRGNVLYGPILAGVRDRATMEEIVFRSLSQAALWDEVKDRLDDSAMRLSGGQQQRLCIARSLALQPDILLLDEPTSGLDPISTARVESSLFELKEEITIVLVPHSVQQAARMSDQAAFLLMGELVEQGSGKELFTSPSDDRTQDYITGRFG